MIDDELRKAISEELTKLSVRRRVVRKVSEERLRLLAQEVVDKWIADGGLDAARERLEANVRDRMNGAVEQAAQRVIERLDATVRADVYNRLMSTPQYLDIICRAADDAAVRLKQLVVSTEWKR